MSSKEILREEIKKRLKNTSPGEFNSQGEKAAALLKTSSIWASYKTIFIFLSMKAEIETQSLLEAALSEGKKVFAPRVEEDKLVFYPVQSALGPWRKGPFGIKEPPDGKPVEEGTSAAGIYPALLITPGLAFDREGRRLGRGRGYYDRFLAELDNKGKPYHAMGLCMDFQLVEKVPAEEYDKKVQSILTCKELNTVA